MDFSYDNSMETLRHSPMVSPMRREFIGCRFLCSSSGGSTTPVLFLYGMWVASTAHLCTLLVLLVVCSLVFL